MSLRGSKNPIYESFKNKFTPMILRSILTKAKDPSKIKERYLQFYKDKGLDTSKPLSEIFKDINSTKQLKERIKIIDKFVRDDKTPSDYIETIKDMKNFIGGTNPSELDEELGYLQESSDWASKLDKIQIPTAVVEEEEKEEKKMPTQEEEKTAMVKEEIATLEAEAAASKSKPADKPSPPKDTIPKKLRKKPKVEASAPKPPTLDTTTEKEMTDIEKAKVKTAKAEAKLQETIESIPDPSERLPSESQINEPEPPKMAEPIKLTTSKKESQINEPKVVETPVKTGLEDIPSKIDLIPPERLSSEFKSAKELESDIEYFFKTFPEPLEKIKKTYSKSKKTPQYLKRTHKRIVAVLRAGAKESKEKVGVIIEGSEFIKDKLREIYLEEINKGLTAEDLIMNVQKEEKTGKEDVGFYEIKTGPSGKEHSQREPIYSKVPEGKEFDPRKDIKREPLRINNLPTEYRSRFTYENNLNENNPFVRPQSKIQLRKLY